jgi:HEAT repeat protein
MSIEETAIYRSRIEELVAEHGTAELALMFVMQASEPVVDAAEALYEAKTISEQGQALSDLSNAVSDLASWLPYREEFR